MAGTVYTSAVGYASGIGKYLATMIDFLVDDQHASLPKIHIIGHSMGAHIAGFAGIFLGKRKVGRITGLDPAYPLFYSFSSDYRLGPEDADFVDVIHTSAGTLGFGEPIGHADFYPNGGVAKQPGCKGIVEILGHVCSHSRACDYFVESIENVNAFNSYSCDSWQNYTLGKCSHTNPIHMGDKTPKTARGKFYLETNSLKPFTKN